MSLSLKHGDKTVMEWAEEWGVGKKHAASRIQDLVRRNQAECVGTAPRTGRRGAPAKLWRLYEGPSLRLLTQTRPSWGAPYWSPSMGFSQTCDTMKIMGSHLCEILKHPLTNVVEHTLEGYRVDLALLPEDRPDALSFWRPISELCDLSGTPSSTMEHRLFEDWITYAHYEVREVRGTSRHKWEARITWACNFEPLTRHQVSELLKMKVSLRG